VKYGVISREDLVRDLTNWDTLYVSGRLHKPVAWITKPEEGDGGGMRLKLEEAVQNNLMGALSASLLLLPTSSSSTSSSDQVEDEELFEGIASISYSGDVRVGIGENPNKVRNIVSANPTAFRQLYSPHLQSLLQEKIILPPSSSSSSQSSLPSSKRYTFKSLDEEKRLGLFTKLPLSIQNQVLELAKGRKVISSSSTSCLPNVIRGGGDKRLLAEVLSRTVRRSSSVQSLKGVFTAGFSKSLSYAALKLLKRINAAR
jgi:translocator assembly and maintenance protein 41